MDKYIDKMKSLHKRQLDAKDAEINYLLSRLATYESPKSKPQERKKSVTTEEMTEELNRIIF